MIWIDEPRHRMDARHLERLLLLERRQDPRQPAREHRLAGSRRATEQEVVPSCRRELERTATTLLAAHVREIERPAPRLSVPDEELGRLELAPQIRHGFGEMAHPDGLDSGKRRFGAGIVRTDDALELRASRSLRHRQNAADAA